MKLKRILLRYHPPGIGLECVPDVGPDGEQPEGSDVVHKDLPPAHEVTSLEVIQSLVTSLLEEETLLQKKKHEKSLTQLLGRLYQIDTEIPEQPTAGATYSIGAKCICFGFSGSNSTYNGVIGSVTKVFEEKKTKYEILFESGTVVKVKENHLLHVLNDGFPYRAGLLPINTRVVITGLRNHGTLNGTVGRVVDYADSTSRYEVRAVETGQLFRVKPDNILGALQPGEEIPEELAMRLQEAGPQGASAQYPGEKAEMSIPVGAIVELMNLRNAGWLNGQFAEVLSVDVERRRYEIRLHQDGTVKKVKAENVHLAPGSEGAGIAGHSGGGGGGPEGPGDVEVPRGSRIELCNLKTAAALNGERAVIVCRADAERYEIRLELDGSAKQIRRENFKIIGQPIIP